MSFTLPKPFKASASKPSLHVDRTTKPGKPSPPQRDVKKSKGSTVIAPGSSTSKPPQPRPPKATDVSRRESKLIPPPPVPTQPAMVTNPTPGPRGVRITAISIL
ncbi:CASP-like protein 4A2 [Larimichthys crocea]|uniref:CASP-like protein 4A2 n=1 Tax=Larimichthys crocea TaxID=215358 RepID=UPI000F5EE762|nr:CASP-like protein 4A2 [Larimichthys crocea]